MKTKKVLLAVLGRGCMMVHPGGPWTPTKDFDWWKLGEMRPEVITTGPDDDPNTVIGGGKLQIAAAAMLHRSLKPALTVFAYGNRSPYLTERGYPSESSIMSGLFKKVMSKLDGGEEPRVEVFNEKHWRVEGSSTFQEVHNVLMLAKQIGVDQVVFQTILVHMNRALPFIKKHLDDDPRLASMKTKVCFEVTESVLLRRDPLNYSGRVFAVVGSQAFVRTLKREIECVDHMHDMHDLAPAAK